MTTKRKLTKLEADSLQRALSDLSEVRGAIRHLGTEPTLYVDDENEVYVQIDRAIAREALKKQETLLLGTISAFGLTA